MNKIRSFIDRSLTKCRKFLNSLGEIIPFIIIPVVLILLPISVIVICGRCIVESWDWVMQHDIVSSIFLCLLGLLIISIITTFLLIFVKQARLVILGRILFFFWLFLTSAIFMYATLMVIISKFSNFNVRMFRDEIASIIGSILVILLLGYLIVSFFSQFSLGVYRRPFYTLYLRPFNSDGNIKKIENSIRELERNHVNILTIANPTTFFRKTIGHTLYLPSVNWKKFLEYYILRAKDVIVVIDDSDGVMWEIFQHTDQFHKYVFIVPNKQVLQKVVDKLSNNLDIKNHFLEVLNTKRGAFIFTVKNGEWKTYAIEELKNRIHWKPSESQHHEISINLNDAELSIDEITKLDKVRNAKDTTFNFLEDLWDFITDAVEFILSIFDSSWFNICLAFIAIVFFSALGILGTILSIYLCIDEGNLLYLGGILISLLSIYISVICFQNRKRW